jgi:hypothetical protein
MLFKLSLAQILVRSQNFYVRIIRHVFEDDDLLRQREWSETIPRMFN